MNEKVLTINGKQVTVSKLPLKRYAELFAAFQNLPKTIDLVSGKSQAEIVTNLPLLIQQCYPDVVSILTIASSLTPDDVDSMGLDDFAEIVTAILEVNNYSAIYDKIKKIVATQPVDGITQIG